MMRRGSNRQADFSSLKRLRCWLIQLLEPLVTDIAPVFAQYHKGELAREESAVARPPAEGGQDNDNEQHVNNLQGNDSRAAFRLAR